MTFVEPISKRQQVELRGVWIASVKNIDWPTRKNMSHEDLKQSYTAILNFYQELNYNAVFVQLRTAGDAFYPSELAPWSEYLTGQQGLPLAEDLLPWLIQQAHERGMEFHAWLNPYRATMDLDTASLHHTHAYYKHPTWMIKYGNKYYFDPGNSEVQEHLLQVIAEILEYPIDGIHFDDYFYPYKIAGAIFDDSISYASRLKIDQSIDDWRRDNINTFIKGCHQIIERIKPAVQFGISPFGVWRNIKDDSTGSLTQAGQTIFDDLYADSRKWIRQGWLDYIAPQIYWSLDYPPASHKILVDWWTTEAGDLPLYIGLGFYKVENNHDTAWNDRSEIPRQIKYSRRIKKVDGFISFSAKSPLNNPPFALVLSEQIFHESAHTPLQHAWSQKVLDIKYDVSTNRSKLDIHFIDKAAKKLVIIAKKRHGLFKRKWVKDEYYSRQLPIQIDVSNSMDLTVYGVNSTGIYTRGLKVISRD